MRSPVLLAGIAALAVPTAAGAKEITAVDVCGTDGCTRIEDRAALRAFEQGSELAQAPPAGRQRSYRLRIRVRDDTGASHVGWTSLWLPDAAVIAFDDGQQGATFTPVEPALSRTLRRAARGHTATAARRYTQPPPPAARVAEVIPAPVRASASERKTADGRPALMWTGAAGIVLLLGAGAWRARRQ
jgi:hypothetical protein